VTGRTGLARPVAAKRPSARVCHFIVKMCGGDDRAVVVFGGESLRPNLGGCGFLMSVSEVLSCSCCFCVRMLVSNGHGRSGGPANL